MRAAILALGLLLIPSAALAEHTHSKATFAAAGCKAAGHHGGHGCGPHHPAPAPPTVLSIVPPRAGTVLVSDGPSVLGQVSAPASIAVPSGKSYNVTAVRGDKVLWSALIVASPGTIDIAWGRGRAPTIQQTPPIVVAPPRSPPPGPMAAPSFKKLLAVVKAESFESDKMEVVSTAAAHHYFTVAQVGRVLDELTFDSDKVKALTVLRSRIVDPENGFLLSSRFDFASSRKQAMAMFSP